MKHSKRVKIGSGISLLTIAALAFFQSHVIASVTIGISDFREISPNLYVDPNFSADEQALIETTLKEARERVVAKYGDVSSEPVLIVSSSAEEAAKFFRRGLPPASTYYLPWGQYIPITPDGNNIDVMAHELVHAEVFHRLGYFKSLRSLPIWFSEGVAMQVDYREGKIQRYILEGHEFPPVSTLETAAQFMTGDLSLHYAAAKVEISSWLSSERRVRLYDFIAEIKGGTSFHEIY